jgi:hypothetical protein
MKTSYLVIALPLLFGRLHEIWTSLTTTLVVAGAILSGLVAAVIVETSENYPIPKMFIALYLN